jgi:hypothetical protein
MLKEFKEDRAQYFRERNPSWSEEEVRAAVARALEFRGYGFGDRQSDRLDALFYLGGLRSVLRGVGIAPPPADAGHTLAAFDPDVPVDRIRSDGWRLSSVNLEDGSEVEASEAELAARLAQIARASKPSIFCGRCRSPLGTRLPAGPKGEPAPVVYVRGARCVPRTCNKLWWEVLDGRRVLSCTHAHLEATQDVFRELMHPPTRAHLATCPDRESHAYVAHVRDSRALMDAINDDWTYAFGVAQLIRWKNTALLHQGRVILKLEVDRIALGRVRMPYDFGDGELVARDVQVPVDGIPLFRGTRGRCPKCGHVQRLE